MALVQLYKDYENSSDEIFTEGILVHELLHASSMYRGYVTHERRRFYIPRVGFCFRVGHLPWGWFLKEGWANMHRAQYFTQYASQKEKERYKTFSIMEKLVWKILYYFAHHLE